MPSRRRKSRVMALQALYEIELVGHDPDLTLERIDELTADDTGHEAVQRPGVVPTYARELVHGVLRNRAEIDRVLQESAPGWPLEQMAEIDKNILRIAIFEILLDNRVPLKVAINEAVELAKEFGSENSPKFVNGVLGAVGDRVAEKGS